jgi:SEC-C motif-containing protein
MRSRYTAFCVGDVDYLMATQHPSRRQPSDRAVLGQTIANTRWISLTILSTQQGQPEDTTGMVEFVACYEGKTAGQLHERSRFVQENGRWFYVDGDVRTL